MTELINASTPWIAKRTGWGTTEYTKTDGTHELTVYKNVAGFNHFATGWTFRTNGWAEEEGYHRFATAKELMESVDSDIENWGLENEDEQDAYCAPKGWG